MIKLKNILLEQEDQVKLGFEGNKHALLAYKWAHGHGILKIVERPKVTGDVSGKNIAKVTHDAYIDLVAYGNKLGVSTKNNDNTNLNITLDPATLVGKPIIILKRNPEKSSEGAGNQLIPIATIPNYVFGYGDIMKGKWKSFGLSSGPYISIIVSDIYRNKPSLSMIISTNGDGLAVDEKCAKRHSKRSARAGKIVGGNNPIHSCTQYSGAGNLSNWYSPGITSGPASYGVKWDTTNMPAGKKGKDFGLTDKEIKNALKAAKSQARKDKRPTKVVPGVSVGS